MHRTYTRSAIALLLALGLLFAVGCNGQDVPETTTPPEPEEESLPFTEPQTETPEPGGDFADIYDDAITLQNNQFVPDTLEVNVGDVVTFVNGDTTEHAIEVGGEDLGTVVHGETVEWTAEEPGTYELICRIHPNMTGEITVR